MGQHLELVCLLQAAEIERLIDSLDEYKLRFFVLYIDINKLKRRNWTDTAMKFR
jgi:hypothetical protein